MIPTLQAYRAQAKDTEVTESLDLDLKGELDRVKREKEEEAKSLYGFMLEQQKQLEEAKEQAETLTGALEY